jgi:hypothetical protein
MRVVAHLKAFYDQVPVPEGTEVTKADIAAGRARMKRDGSGWTMRVKKTVDTHNLTALPELEIVKHAISLAMPKRGAQLLTRKQVVADYLATQPYVDAFDHGDIKHFEVHDDAGPDEKLFRETAAPFLSALYAPTGKPLLSAEQLEKMVAAYLEPLDAQGHVDHLHTRFGVAKAVTP